jgi:hypothetical protein
MSDANQLLERLSKTFNQTLGVDCRVIATAEEPPHWAELLDEERRLKENEPSTVHQIWSVLDVLGTYEPLTCTITIYQGKIQEWTESHRWDPAILERIVRIHEYGHAFVHVGISETEESGENAWLLERNRFWAAVNPATDNHEFLAQSFTWIALKQFADEGELAKFEELMETQPDCYRLWGGGKKPTRALWEQYIEVGRCVKQVEHLAAFWAWFMADIRRECRQQKQFNRRSLRNKFASPGWSADQNGKDVIDDL